MTPIPFRCQYRFAVHPHVGWWLSVHGVVVCLACYPPMPGVEVRRGTSLDAPLVDPLCSSELAGRWAEGWEVMGRAAKTRRVAKGKGGVEMLMGG